VIASKNVDQIWAFERGKAFSNYFYNLSNGNPSKPIKKTLFDMSILEKKLNVQNLPQPKALT
jgi:hypothetical protein